MDKIRVLAVDDHTVVRQGLMAMLSPRNGMEVVGDTASGQDAVRLERELNPDVTLMDLIMPGMDGIVTTAAIKKQNPNARILILTSFDEPDLITEAMIAGASGFILKDSGTDELMQAIRSVHSGHLVISPTVMENMTKRPSRQESEVLSTVSLTQREVEVLQGIVDGLTNKAIALRLDISSTTVRSHVSNILSKLGATNRTQAALLAQENGLCSPSLNG